MLFILEGIFTWLPWLPVFGVGVIDALVQCGHDELVALESFHKQHAGKVVLISRWQLADAGFQRFEVHGDRSKVEMLRLTEEFHRIVVNHFLDGVL